MSFELANFHAPVWSILQSATRNWKNPCSETNAELLLTLWHAEALPGAPSCSLEVTQSQSHLNKQAVPPLCHAVRSASLTMPPEESKHSPRWSVTEPAQIPATDEINPIEPQLFLRTQLLLEVFASSVLYLSTSVVHTSCLGDREGWSYSMYLDTSESIIEWDS